MNLNGLIDYYKCSKINYNFKVNFSDPSSCTLYAPHCNNGVCRLCFKKPIDHAKYDDYKNMCIVIQKNWRIYYNKKKIKKKLFCLLLENHANDFLYKPGGIFYKELIKKYDNKFNIA